MFEKLFNNGSNNVMMEDLDVLTLKDTKTLPASVENTDIVAPGNTFLAEMSLTGITASTSCEEMSEYDQAVEVETVVKSSRDSVLNRKTRKIVDSRGREIRAWITEDENRDRDIKVRQRYSNGTFSTTLSMSQADVVMTAMAELSKDVKLQKHVERFLMKLGETYMNRFCGMKEDALEVQTIVDMVAAELPYIPVYSDDMTDVIRVSFYQKSIGTVKTLTSQVLNDHKAYYPLTEDDLIYVARNMGLDKLSMLRKLKQYDLLYLTPSSRGYQTNVRLNGMGEDGFTAWRYCLIRDEELENCDEYLEEDDF